MELCHISDLVHIYGCIVSSYVIGNDEYAASVCNTPFHSVSLPPLSLTGFIDRVFRYFNCSGECYMLSLIYIDRLIKYDAFIINNYSVYRVIITSIMIAAKYFDDVYYTNSFYAEVGGINVDELNNLEVDFLCKIRFNLYVTPDVFQKYYNELLDHCQYSCSNCHSIRLPTLINTTPLDETPLLRFRTTHCGQEAYQSTFNSNYQSGYHQQQNSYYQSGYQSNYQSGYQSGYQSNYQSGYNPNNYHTNYQSNYTISTQYPSNYQSTVYTPPTDSNADYKNIYQTLPSSSSQGWTTTLPQDGQSGRYYGNPIHSGTPLPEVEDRDGRRKVETSSSLYVDPERMMAMAMAMNTVAGTKEAKMAVNAVSAALISMDGHALSASSSLTSSSLATTTTTLGQAGQKMGKMVSGSQEKEWSEKTQPPSLAASSSSSSSSIPQSSNTMATYGENLAVKAMMEDTTLSTMMMTTTVTTSSTSPYNEITQSRSTATRKSHRKNAVRSNNGFGDPSGYLPSTNMDKENEEEEEEEEEDLFVISEKVRPRTQQSNQPIPRQHGNSTATTATTAMRTEMAVSTIAPSIPSSSSRSRSQPPPDLYAFQYFNQQQQTSYSPDLYNFCTPTPWKEQLGQYPTGVSGVTGVTTVTTVTASMGGGDVNCVPGAELWSEYTRGQNRGYNFDSLAGEVNKLM